MYDGVLCNRAMKEGKKGKPTGIPSKSHSIAVFIIPMVLFNTDQVFQRYWFGTDQKYQFNMQL